MSKGKSNPASGSHERVIENRKARHQYTILETLECGIVLRGSEIKSIRDGHAAITDGYVLTRVDPPTLEAVGLNIDPYGPAASHQHTPKRARKLLAHKREILKLARQVEQKGVTIVPLKLYFKNGYAKLLVGLAKGKSKADKRQSIQEREVKRDIDRAMSRRDRR